MMRNEWSNRGRDALREHLRAEHGVCSLLINVPKLSKIICVSQASIYAHMRNGTFFLPCAYINKTPMVAVEDLISWVCAPRSGP